MTCDLFALLAWIAFVTLYALVSPGVVENICTYTRLVESTANAYPLGFAHGVGLLSLPLLEWTLPLGYLELFLPLHK
jgi:hypothetical protein